MELSVLGPVMELPVWRAIYGAAYMKGQLCSSLYGGQIIELPV
jgi:hypothetical protein